MQFHHAGQHVEDLEASIIWYRENLGYTLERRFILPDAELDIAVLTAPDQSRLELLGSTSTSPSVRASRRGQKHICFIVEDLDEVAEELRLEGVRFAQEPKDIPEAGVRNFWILDPEDNLVEYIQQL